MDRNEIEQHLVIAEQRVSDGARHIDHQLRIIKDLERDGHDATRARQVLQTMETAQVMHDQERDRLVALLTS